MLFVDPNYYSRGIGWRLADYALSLKGSITVDVDEQNSQVVAFYERDGVTKTGRSALDESDRPFPLLHMALPEGPLAR